MLWEAKQNRALPVKKFWATICLEFAKVIQKLLQTCEDAVLVPLTEAWVKRFWALRRGARSAIRARMWAVGMTVAGWPMWSVSLTARFLFPPARSLAGLGLLGLGTSLHSFHYLFDFHGSDNFGLYHMLSLYVTCMRALILWLIYTWNEIGEEDTCKHSKRESCTASLLLH